MYSASSSPLATICASAIIVAVYGRIGYAAITSTSAYLAACADATQPLIRTVFFLPSVTVPIVHSILNLFRRPIRKILQLLRLPSVQARCNGKCCVHSHHAGIEVEFGHTLETPRRALFDTNAATFAVVDQNLVEPVRTCRTHDAGLGTHQITVIAGVAGAATETAARLIASLFFRVP